MISSSTILPLYLLQCQSGFSQSLGQIIADLNGQTNIIDPRPFLASIFGSSSMLGRQQQDSHEFLVALLSRLSHPVYRVDVVLDYNRLAPFQGIVSERIICKSCRSIASQKITLFSVLSLDPNKSISLALTELMSRLEHLDGYKCPCGVSSQCYKSTDILRWPALLMIHINRIRMDSYGNPFKDKSHMSPDQIILQGGKKYLLRSYIVHGGEINSGHYVAYRRASPTQFQFISDSDSHLVSTKDLSDQPYLLLYELY